MTALIIHGHFYQPPRENPWTGEIDRELSAAPYHDWNARIHAECYGPNAFAPLGGDVAEQVVNNYGHISFNFGATLLSWLERAQPRTYRRILEADVESRAQRGDHGNAIAQAYGHAILPLCNERDRLTQVLWGLEDFRYRFRREPESLWLPETACNHETLDLLIEQGMRYVILAPEQAAWIRPTESEEWTKLAPGQVDTTRAYKYLHSAGDDRSLAIYFYHGPLARAIAFERALTSSRGLVDRFLEVAQTGDLVNVATDGETYGHHFKFGDLCLAHAMEVEAKAAGFWVTNYGEHLDHKPPDIEVEISHGPEGEGSSWSCAHGVGRWSRDCGCHTGGEEGWNQGWRAPLRAALDFLRDDAANAFESLGEELLHDPWAARNAYIRVILNREAEQKKFLDYHVRGGLTTAHQSQIMRLLEMQRDSLLMFTSCGWFFSDLGGLETIQVLRYAARVMQLQSQLGFEPPREQFLEMLAEARSNITLKGNGADIYLRHAEALVQEVS